MNGTDVLALESLSPLGIPLRTCLPYGIQSPIPILGLPTIFMSLLVPQMILDVCVQTKTKTEPSNSPHHAP